MQENIEAELYLSFAGIFHRPTLEIANCLEEIIDLWSDEIRGQDEIDKLNNLKAFCLSYPPGESRLNALWEHYIPLFETGSVEAPPYASVYRDDENLVWGEEAFRVNEFYKSAGWEIGQSSKELPDHLAVELEFLALMTRDGQNALVTHFRSKYLLPFLNKILPLIIKSSRPVYADAARLLQIWQLNLKEGDLGA